MKTTTPFFFALTPIFILNCCLQLSTLTSCQGGNSALVITYQPIMSQGESDFSLHIMAVPFLDYHHHGKPPYAAIAHPHELLTNAPRNIRTDDANLISRCGIRIGQSLDDDLLYVRFEDLHVPQGSDIDPDIIVEATLECIRRIAHENKDRPNLQITGKPGDEAKWEALQKAFADHDLSQPFKLPGS